MTMVQLWAGAALDAMALFGCVAVAASTRAAWRLGRAARAAPPNPRPVPVTMLKPLHGDEPRLAENLATFRDQDWAAPIQIVAGVARADDPAAAIATSLGESVDLVVDGRRHGANAKIGNLVNMMPVVRHDLIVLSDSDISAPPDYLKHIVAALEDPKVGVVTIAYGGRGDTGFWSRFGAAIVSYHFMPSILLSLDLGMGDVCMGSTIAMRRETLEAIGGFDRYVDTLADDFAIGQAVRDLGLEVVVPPVFVTHASIETSFAEMARHELRWMATVRTVNWIGHLGSLVMHALPLALIALVVAPGIVSATVAAIALTTRLVSALLINHVLRRATIPLVLVPFRDLMTFGVHVTSLFVRRVDWRGARLTMRRAGRIEAEGA
ncbi:MAG: bacteriohopanetetrol glucosamine biosynthesis glycosyltransferase HpnI [Sphingomonas sp.]